MRKFLVSLSDLDLDRGNLRTWQDLRESDDWKTKAKLLAKIQVYLDRLPELEHDVIDLYFFQAKKQREIARMLGISQQAVSHRMYNAFKRIKFMVALPKVDFGQMRIDLESMLENPFTVNVLCDFAITSSQTVTANNLQASQQRVCWHLNSALGKLRASLHMDALFYRNYFEKLMANRNIFREVLAGRRKKKVDDREEISEIRRSSAETGETNRPAADSRPGGDTNSEH